MKFFYKNSGFTLLEVMVALVIFAMTAIVTINLTKAAARGTNDTKEMTIATWLLQNVMAELETKIETEGMDKGCEKKKEGKFPSPYERFTWATFCYEIDFNLSQTAAQAYQKEKDADFKEDPIQKMILQVASQYISKALRELHVEVYWTLGKQKRKVEVTTQIARYDQPLAIPGLGGPTTGSTGIETTGGTQ